MRDLDYLQIVILKHPDEVKHFSIAFGEGGNRETGTVAGIPQFINEIEQVVGQFKTTNFRHAYYNRKDLEIKEQKTRYLMKLPGFFFLHADYRDKLRKIIMILKTYTPYFHLTRLDMAWTLENSFQEISTLLKKVEYSDTIERTLRDKAKKLTRVIFYNTRFMSISYNKMNQVKKKKKKDDDYKKLYAQKYGTRETRLEHRLLNKSELGEMTELIKEDIEDFFRKFESYTIEKASIRLTHYPLKLKKILSIPNSPKTRPKNRGTNKSDPA